VAVINDQDRDDGRRSTLQRARASVAR